MGQDLNHVRRTDWISVGKKLWTGGRDAGRKVRSEWALRIVGRLG